MSLSIFNFSVVSGIIVSAVALALGTAKTVEILYAQKKSADTSMSDFYDHSNEIEVVGLGSSHTVGLHFPSLGAEGHSFLKRGIDIEASHLKLKTILPHTPQLKCAILSVQPGFLVFSQNSVNRGKRKWPTYQTPWPKLNSNLSINEWITVVKSKLHALIRIPTYKARTLLLGKEHINPSGPQLGCKKRFNNPLVNDEFGIRHGYPRYPLKAECIEEHAISTSKRHLKAIQKVLDFSPDIRESNIAYLRSMAQLLADHNASLVFVAMPFTKEYLARVSYEELKDIKLLSNAFSDDPNIAIQDFTDFFHNDQSKENIYFFDDDHLVIEGAKVFSTALRKQIPQCL